MADVSERRVRPLQEAVGNKNWKQALQLCEKWHKKGEKSDRFLALRAYVLAKQQDTASAKRGQYEIVQLCHRTPPITDLDTIYQIQAALNDLRITDDGGRKLWERAAAASPDDKEIAMTWLDEAIDRCDWQSAQKATMALRKSSPKDRNYEFWTIFMCYLIHQDQSISEKERTMFGTLAYRMLSKAAEAVSKEQEQVLSAGKAIQSPEELFLLIRVYLNTGYVQGAKALLINSTTLGPRSALFKLDPDLHKSLQLDVLQAAQDWPAIANELRMVTTGLSTEDVQIGRMLKILFDAEDQTESPNLTQEIRDCLERALETFPNSRDLRYGMLRVYQMENAKGRCTADDLVKACEHYFSMRCRQPTCFDELRDPVGLLEATLQQGFVEFAQDEARESSQSPTASAMPLLNAFKLEYCFLVSPAISTTITREFVSKVVYRYREFCSANSESDESVAQLAMLACMATLRANQVEQENKGDPNLQYVSYLQTGFLLRYCLTRIKDDYLTLVVLTRISTLLGAVSFSAMIFKKLSIKNLQWENAGHLFLTRLSTLHPQRSNGDGGTFDPLQTLDVAMAANANSVRSVRRHIMAGLNHKSYVNVVETVGLREDLRNSFSKQLYEVETARTKRLRDLPDSERGPFSSGPFVDRRDFGFIPSFEHPYVKPFAHHLEAGPNPKDAWLHVMKICKAITDMMNTEYHEPQSIKQNEVEQLAAAISELQNLLKTNNDELTQTETDNCTLQSNVGNAITLRLHQTIAPTTSTDPKDKASFDDSIQYIQDWLNNTAKQQIEHSFDHSIKILGGTSIAPSWQYLHPAFSTLESLQFIALFLALSHTKPSKSKSKSKSSPFVLPTEQQKRMLDLVLQIESSIHDSARTLKTNLNASGVLGRMIDVVFGKGGEDNAGVGALSAVVGKELEKLPDAETVAECFCGEVRESWEDALEGILGVRVRRWK